MPILTLPPEIWLLILEQLCPHCHCDDIPDFRLIQHQQEISALWAVSLTCRSIKRLSRQYLYHCFYSTPTHDRASKFLRTLISQPQLGRYLRILSLPNRLSRLPSRASLLHRPFTAPGHSAKEGEDREIIRRQNVRNWIELSGKLSIPVPLAMVKAMSTKDGSDEEMKLDEGTLDESRHWLHNLILRYCPGVTHLELPCISGPKYQGKTPPTLQNLQVLLCKSVRGGHDLDWFLQESPFMTRLITNEIYYSIPNGPITPFVTNIRRISTAIWDWELPYIFSQCPQLEDIEIHVKPSDLPVDVTLPDLWPASIKRQVVRLSWSSLPMISPRWFTDEDSVIVPPIRDFKNLEILEIDRSSLYLALKRTLDPNMTEEELGSQLPTILPPSLRILHTAFTIPLLGAVVNELQALAVAKKTFLRNLSMVQIDHPPATEPGEITVGEDLEILGVTETVADAGLELRFGLNPSTPRLDSMGIIPMRPGTMEPLPGIYHDYGGFFFIDY